MWNKAGIIASKATTHRCYLYIGYDYSNFSVDRQRNQRQSEKGLAWSNKKKDWTVNKL